MPPIKSDVCIDGERVAVFLGADYKQLTLEQLDVLIRKLQSAAAIVRRKQRRDRRDRCCTMPSTEHAA